MHLPAIKEKCSMGKLGEVQRKKTNLFSGTESDV